MAKTTKFWDNRFQVFYVLYLVKWPRDSSHYQDLSFLCPGQWNSSHKWLKANPESYIKTSVCVRNVESHWSKLWFHHKFISRLICLTARAFPTVLSDSIEPWQTSFSCNESYVYVMCDLQVVSHSESMTNTMSHHRPVRSFQKYCSTLVNLHQQQQCTIPLMSTRWRHCTRSISIPHNSCWQKINKWTMIMCLKSISLPKHKLTDLKWNGGWGPVMGRLGCQSIWWNKLIYDKQPILSSSKHTFA